MAVLEAGHTVAFPTPGTGTTCPFAVFSQHALWLWAGSVSLWMSQQVGASVKNVFAQRPAMQNCEGQSAFDAQVRRSQRLRKELHFQRPESPVQPVLLTQSSSVAHGSS